VKFKNGRVESTDRSRHAENADGDTLNRDIQSERHGDHMDRQGQIKSSTGIDAESRGTLKKTDDGFIARGGIAGKDGVAGGTIVRDGDQTRIRGGATDGKNATWGRAHCNGSHCYGGRVKVKVKDYDYHPYYYYPYYYGYYSCPYGGMQTWYGSYGTPVYGCSNVTVIHTTISMGSTSTNYLTAPSESSSFSGPKAEKPVAESDWPDEAEVSSEPVLMYEVSDEVVVYATPNDPAGVYSRKHGERYYWTPGPASRSTEVAGWLESAEGMETPTANATVIQYKLGKRVVYLTNERPVPDVYAESVDHLFVWIPGVKDPSEEDRALIAQVGKAHRSGGKGALDREVRKLQKDRDPPPPVEGPATS
jgi:hypothetical protein